MVYLRLIQSFNILKTNSALDILKTNSVLTNIEINLSRAQKLSS